MFECFSVQSGSADCSEVSAAAATAATAAVVVQFGLSGDARKDPGVVLSLAK